MTLASPPLPAPEIFAPPVRRSVVLSGISWKLYQSMLAEIRNGAVRLTYDHGWLEIMTLSPLHEKVKKIVARLIEAYADAEEIDVEGFGSTTFGREELQRGLEPDECYHVAPRRGRGRKDPVGSGGRSASRFGCRSGYLPSRHRQATDLRRPRRPGGLAV